MTGRRGDNPKASGHTDPGSACLLAQALAVFLLNSLETYWMTTPHLTHLNAPLMTCSQQPQFAASRSR